MERSDRRAAACRVAVAVRGQRMVGSTMYRTFLLLGTVTLWVLLLSVLAAIGGCVQQNSALSHSQYGNAGDRHACGAHRHLYAEEPRASLIFLDDPDLAPIPADQIARADWPTTDGLTSYGQTIYYRQYWNDQQGLGPYYTNYGYRTFTSWTTGVQTGQ
jgi:hypothetical protein